MARMVPELTDLQLDEIDSHAEARVYRACRDSLPARVLVLHRVDWILRKNDGDAGDGETDFLICDPEGGLLVVEVKGGGVRFDPLASDWTSCDAKGRVHPIKDPFRQARDAKYAVLTKLKEHRRWGQVGRGRITLGHAVVFPDLSDVSAFESPRSPRAIVAGRADLDGFARWFLDAMEFWRGERDGSDPPGRGVLALVEEVFARPIEARLLIGSRLGREEDVRTRLTADQARVLSLLGKRRRAAICGGAGTGKTVLAHEKATRLAREGFRTLLVCYNRPLADHLAHLGRATTGLEVASFHALCARQCERARRLGRDVIAEAEDAEPAGDRFDVTLPLALAYSVDVLPDRYDAIVVDEGQDFREEYWLPLELLLADGDRSPLYVFFDQNQALYRNASSFPVQDEPFVLTTNCRNTRAIHATSYQFFRGEPTDPPALDGLPVAVIGGATLGAQASAIRKALHRLLTRESVPAEDVVVLVADAANKLVYYELLCALPPPGGFPWLREDHHANGVVLVETVARFKGLEKAVVFLWLGGKTTPESSPELLYVGSSRAKALLNVVGPEAACEWATGGRAETLGDVGRGHFVPSRPGTAKASGADLGNP